MGPREAYEELARRSRERAVLASCSALLGWDEQTYMPPGGSGHRGEQMALLAGLHHERATDPALGDLLAEVEGSDLVPEPDSPVAANVREWRRQYDRLTRLPRRLVEELARATSLAQQEWNVARREDDFPRLRSALETIFGLKRSEAECLGGAVPYDALLDEYEPGATSRDLTTLFGALRAELVPLISAISEARRRPDREILHREYPVDRQRLFGEMVAGAVGFDFRRGRLDTTAHPFCSGIGPGDCRITARYDPHDFGDAFFSVLHEVGHGLYDQGLDPEHYGTPAGEAASLGVHESQSRLWENAVGRSRAFWEHWFPPARTIFRDALGDASLESFLSAINSVEPSLIRIGADEVTYNLHVLIRFNLERALLAGELAVEDIPTAWAEGYRDHLGIVPEDDATGCLQDIHWSAGLIGYFPTYTLGNVYAAQLFAAATRDLGDLDRSLAQGDASGLLGWLRERVHRQGQCHRPAALIRLATGAPPDHRALVEALVTKYSALSDL
jgi:carboxypeptidase Taq